jgi:hypothetical protein
VLDTKFLYYDPVKDVDVFQAYSPHGLSEFALASVFTAGNPLQLLYLSAMSRVSPSATPASKPKNSPVSYSGGGGGGSYGGSGNIVDSSPSTDSPAPSATNVPGPQAPSASPVQGNPPVSSNLPPPPTVAFQGNSELIPSSVVAPSQGPGVSIFTVFIEAAAAVSVFLLVVFSVYTRYRQKEKN